MKSLFAPPPLLSWLPGETLFSLVSRHHYFRANATSAATCEQFFGHPRQGTQHDFPAGLNEFVARTEDRFGSVDEIARRHTLLAFYGAFTSKDEVQHLISRMASRNVAHLKLRLGILTSRFRAHHPLKACPKCVQLDRERHGWSYWHLEHQFPGVWVCLKHNHLLQESDQKANGVRRFLWHLPSQMQWQTVRHDADIAPPLNSLRALTETILDLMRLVGEGNVDLSLVHQIYRVEFARRGWMTSSGSLRMAPASACFFEHVQCLRCVPELQALPQTMGAAAAQLGRILRPPRAGIHPLRHAVMCQWLFGGEEISLECALRHPTTSLLSAKLVDPLERTSKRDPDVGRRQELLSLLTTHHFSLRRASARLGIDVGTAIVWATAEGVQVGRRPKKLTGVVRQTAIAALRHGADKAVVANEAGVAIGTITKLLFGEFGLHSEWHAARQALVQTRMRQDWLDARRANPALGAKYLRSLNPAAYAWLYRNDREWLQAQKPAETRPLGLPGTTRVRWDERDRDLSSAVEKAAYRLITADGHKKLMLWQLCQALPELRAKLNALPRLPLTCRAIDAALGRNPRDARLDGELLTS